jgi:hypothetical protein
VKQAIMSVAPHFSAKRMVREYAEQVYGPALRASQPAPSR